MTYDALTRAYVLVEVAPNGAERVRELFEADSEEAAEEYAAQHNVSELDKHVQRFRIAGYYGVRSLYRTDDGMLDTAF